MSEHRLPHRTGTELWLPPLEVPRSHSLGFLSHLPKQEGQAGPLNYFPIPNSKTPLLVQGILWRRHCHALESRQKPENGSVPYSQIPTNCSEAPTARNSRTVNQKGLKKMNHNARYYWSWESGMIQGKRNICSSSSSGNSLEYIWLSYFMPKTITVCLKQRRNLSQRRAVAAELSTLCWSLFPAGCETGWTTHSIWDRNAVYWQEPGLEGHH